MFAPGSRNIDMHRKHLLAVMIMAVLCLVVPVHTVLAAVTLVRFEASAHQGNSILVVWETATELDTSGFRLFRAQIASPSSWGTPIDAQGPKGNVVTGAIYEYTDLTVTSGVRYFYLLEELSNAGTSQFGPIWAGIDLPADTSTSTATATVTRNPTATSRPTITGIPLTDTPPPTATRQFTNTPAVPSGTPLPGVQSTAPPVVRRTATSLPAASVKTPTGTAPQAPASVVPAPIEPAPTQLPALTPTPQVQPAGLETATPRPPRESTPSIFEASGPSATPSPDAASQAAAQSGRNTALAWVIGGSAIGLAGLLAAALLYMRSRQP